MLADHERLVLVLAALPAIADAGDGEHCDGEERGGDADDQDDGSWTLLIGLCRATLRATVDINRRSAPKLLSPQVGISTVTEVARSCAACQRPAAERRRPLIRPKYSGCCSRSGDLAEDHQAGDSASPPRRCIGLVTLDRAEDLLVLGDHLLEVLGAGRLSRRTPVRWLIRCPSVQTAVWPLRSQSAWWKSSVEDVEGVVVAGPHRPVLVADDRLELGDVVGRRQAPPPSAPRRIRAPHGRTAQSVTARGLIGATNVPSWATISTSPSSRSRASASRTGVRLTQSQAASSFSRRAAARARTPCRRSRRGSPRSGDPRRRPLPPPRRVPA